MGLHEMQLQFRLCFPPAPGLLAQLPRSLGAFGMDYSGRSISGSATAGGCRRHHLIAHARNRHTPASVAGRAPAAV